MHRRPRPRPRGPPRRRHSEGVEASWEPPRHAQGAPLWGPGDLGQGCVDDAIGQLVVLGRQEGVEDPLGVVVSGHDDRPPAAAVEPRVGLEGRAHRPVGVVEPRASGAGGDVEHLADLVRIEAQVVVEHEDRPLLGRQPPEPALDLVAIGERGEVIRRRRSVDRQDPNGRDPGALAARLRIADVDEHSLEPGVEPLRIAEAGQLAPGDHQRLLHRVLGEADVAEDAARDPEEQVAPRPGQDGERLPVPALGLLHEVAIHSLRPLGGAHRVRRPSLQSDHLSRVFKLRFRPHAARTTRAPGPGHAPARSRGPHPGGRSRCRRIRRDDRRDIRPADQTGVGKRPRIGWTPSVAGHSRWSITTPASTQGEPRSARRNSARPR